MNFIEWAPPAATARSIRSSWSSVGNLQVRSILGRDRRIPGIDRRARLPCIPGGLAGIGVIQVRREHPQGAWGRHCMDEGNQVLGTGQVDAGEGLSQMSEMKRDMSPDVSTKSMAGANSGWSFHPLDLLYDRPRAVEVGAVEPLDVVKCNPGGVVGVDTRWSSKESVVPRGPVAQTLGQFVCTLRRFRRRKTANGVAGADEAVGGG